MKRGSWDVGLVSEAFGLRLCWLRNKDSLRLYEAMTFPRGAWLGCEFTLRRCAACGFLAKERSPYLVDVLDEDGDIVQDFALTRGGFRYLRRVLGARWVRDEGG